MSMDKNERVILKIEDMTTEGEGVGKVNGCALFVKDTVIGDEIEAVVTKMKKNYGYARLLRVIVPSPHRVEAPCPIARPCGGCQLQAMSYEEQLAWKREKVRRNLQRIGGLDVEVDPVIGMEHPWRYRNKTQVPVGRDRSGRIQAGFFAGRTHSIIPQEDCLLAPEENGKIIRIVTDFMTEKQIAPYEEEAHCGLVRHILIRKAFATGEIMVCLILNGRSLPAAGELVQRLRAVPGMASISLNVNEERTNVILGREIINLFGPGYITDRIGSVSYEISPLSFFQVNPVQTEKLYRTALEFAGLTGSETVWDLYCGIGTISLFLAQKAKMVYGVEIVPAAIDDARRNAVLGGFDNTEFFVGKSEDVLPAWYEEQLRSGAVHPGEHPVDVIVVDPPRKGCQESLLATMVQMAPERIVYVSCDSATLARDLKYLCKEGYRVEKVQPCDMFPMTGHVETVCLLSNRKPDTKVRIDVDLEDYYRIKDAKKTQN